MDKYMSVQESMLKCQLELLGAKVYKMKGSIRYVEFCIDSIKFKYIYHVNRKNKYFLERICPYSMPIATFEKEEEIIKIIKDDIAKFRNARNSNKFERFINTNKNLVKIAKSFEDIYLHYNVSKYDLNDIDVEMQKIESKLNKIIKENEIVFKISE
ncbi:hypothetical protein [Clostridium massiliodielmoense]|uniref:hypothetical protein n=1 Tax=Clostridium massiliodielmoense TaxID=1776385 RepID=UPI000166B37E|nr:hypothetical protein [Clostridium massiliodielmoense]EDS76633.1 conserved hypothetical protein [Clostridium botulinum C str. Eklund]KEH97584.1 hypothetical protein Z962_02930 [Clostridium botulinum C/D str. BKT12695]NEZ49701.1 hypothetical protein [Clostridium botulinum]